MRTAMFLTAAATIVLGASGAPARAGMPLALSETHAGHVNFIGTAGSLRTESNQGDACAVGAMDTALLTGLPAGATIRAAHLYWAGSWSENRRSTARTPDWTVTLDGTTVTAARQFTEFHGNGSNRYDYFGARADVTAQVAAKGNGLYTFGDLQVNTARPHCDAQGVLAGWSLIVIYDHPSESNRVVNLFEGFQAYRGGQITVTVDNFQVASGDIDGRVGHLTWEGDAENSGGMNGFGERLHFNGAELVDLLNPAGNQFNSTVNASGSRDTWGADLDIYDVTPWLSAGDTQASAVYQSGEDLVLLSAEVISVTNVPLTDLGFTCGPDAPLELYEPGRITFDVTNHGPNDEPMPVVLTLTLPPEIGFAGTASAGWTVDATALPVVTFTHAGPLATGASVPLELDVQAVAGPGSYPVAVSLAGGSFDFEPANNTGSPAATVVVPPAELITTTWTETVADPVNATTNPKAIPGATVVYTLSTQNIRAGQADRNSLKIVLPVPPETMLWVQDFPGSTDGPILFVDGPVASGLTFGRGRFGRGNPALHFSNDGGASFGYTPVPDALGYDPNVTHIRVKPSGIFAGRNITGPSSFFLRYQVMVR